MPASSVFTFISLAAPFIMVTMAVVIFGGLVMVNRHLRSQQPAETPPLVFALPTQPPAEMQPPAPPVEE